jgi:hypothetical protein
LGLVPNDQHVDVAGGGAVASRCGPEHRNGGWLGRPLWISARIRVQSSSRNEDRDAIAFAAMWLRFSVYR